MSNDAAPQRPNSVLVLGGAGFIGRHTVAALLQSGVRVVIGTRFPGDLGKRMPPHPSAPDAEQREIKLEQLGAPESWREIVDDVDAVINCVGILRQRRRETYDAVHHRAPTALAAACRHQRKRFVHVSALGLDRPARSRFLTSKRAGEAGIREHGDDWIIVRPSLLDGTGGFGASWLRGIARLPVFVAPADAKGHIAALDVGDLGLALARLALADAATLRLDQSRLFELGGAESWEFRDYVFALRRTYTDRASLCIPLPGLLARLGAHICDVLHVTPFSFGHWELLQRDNVPRTNRLPELLGRPPISVVSRNFLD
ncbi:MAG: NAD(P)H-binding protein [Gammaproteobacteria bacterium]|nr:NAD(P)H-binding protein [Gammaproteobacteria bacterium]